MRLILDDSLPANAKFLSKDDFHRGLGEPFGHWIIISLYFSGLGDTEEQQVLASQALKITSKENGTLMSFQKN